MARAFAFPGDTFPADDFDAPDEAWFIEPKDKDPRPEFDRQREFVNWMRRHAPEVIVYAVPNGARLTPWQKIRRQQEGAVAGALDLEIKWAPARCFAAEFKDGDGAPTKDQRVMLNRLYRADVPCGVYRTAARLIEDLRAAGCPV